MQLRTCAQKGFNPGAPCPLFSRNIPCNAFYQGMSFSKPCPADGRRSDKTVNVYSEVPQAKGPQHTGCISHKSTDVIDFITRAFESFNTLSIQVDKSASVLKMECFFACHICQGQLSIIQ